MKRSVADLRDLHVKLKCNSGDVLAALACGWPLKKKSISGSVCLTALSHVCGVPHGESKLAAVKLLESI